MVSYSHSRVSTFEQCRLKYKYQYIDRLETEIETTAEAFMGDMVHQALAKLYTDVMFQKILALPEVLAFFNDLWQKNWNDAIVIVNEGLTQENFRLMGERFLRDYYNSYTPFNQSKTIALETSDKVEIDKDVHFHIRIDRLSLLGSTTYEIHDYKTSKSLPTMDQIKNDRQLTLYAYGIKRMYPDAQKVRLIWHFLSFNKEIAIERSDEELELAKEKVLQLIKEIEVCEDFPPDESALCRWCVFQPHCILYKHHFQIKDKPPSEYLEDDGVKLVNRFAELSEKMNHLEGEREAVRRALIEFAKKNEVEVVYGSDVKASVSTCSSISFPHRDDPRQKEFYSTLKLLGLWDRLAAPDMHELGRMISSKEIYPELVTLLNSFIEKSENIRVTIRKK